MKNMTFRFAVFALIAPGLAVAQSDRRPVNTYSIVARDAETGQLGVAVQSHWFSVGTLVPFAEAGVGAVATQSFIEVSYGPLGLELMAMGRTAPEALRALVSTDTDEAVRQVAMVDVNGNVAAHTGSKAIDAAGPATGAAATASGGLLRPRAWVRGRGGPRVSGGREPTTAGARAHRETRPPGPCALTGRQSRHTEGGI